MISIGKDETEYCEADIEILARRVIAGDYGTGPERVKRLGKNYEAVQRKVNEIIAGIPEVHHHKNESIVTRIKNFFFNRRKRRR